ncbi:hypothetical protein AGMMS50268_37270 [Spirochaetia bacterium]|nr:hypothetical protein AGMMS50268_37270 [Spirochaetia bacterium]
MMKQTFSLNDGSILTLPVISQKSKSFDAMDIQISKVVDLNIWSLHPAVLSPLIGTSMRKFPRTMR